MTITEFLLARIAEDEAWARARQREDFQRHRVSAHRRHLAPDDPTRVLAECEAKRRIVERAAAALPVLDHDARWAFDETMRDLAAVYADHPDYREEWRP